MKRKSWKLIAALCMCGFVLSATPGETKAAGYSGEKVDVETCSSYIVKIDAPSAVLYAAGDERSVVIGRVSRGATYDVASYEKGWAKVNTGSGTGYLRISGQATIVETTREKVDEGAALRAEVVQYALQFVGNPYVWGGSDPHYGADCSGFTSYVMRHTAGVNLSHSSAAQAGEGVSVPIDRIKPGDLVFYSNGSRINHVAIYMGDGQIVHASTEKTGIKVSRLDHRAPVKVVNVLPL